MAEPANHALLAGEPGAMRLLPLPMPAAPSEHQLLIRMLFAPVNPADLLAIDGTYAFAVGGDQPLGAEGVGVVERAGAQVKDLTPGDLVLPLDRGNWTSWRLVDRARIVTVPVGVDPMQAAMMRINPPTAWGLLDASGAGSGDCLLQNAASSAVARWVRILAARRGVHVVDIVRPGSSYGTGAVIDDAKLAQAVASASGGRPVRAALDCVAGEATGRLAACLADGGQVIVFGHLSGEPSSIRSQLLTGKGLAVRGFSLRPTEQLQTVAAREAMFAELWSIAHEAAVTLPIRAVVPLSQGGAAIEMARAAGEGRVLIDMQAISGM